MGVWPRSTPVQHDHQHRIICSPGDAADTPNRLLHLGVTDQQADGLDPLMGSRSNTAARPVPSDIRRAWPNGIPIEHRLVDIAAIFITGIVPVVPGSHGIAMNADSHRSWRITRTALPGRRMGASLGNQVCDLAVGHRCCATCRASSSSRTAS